MRAEIEILLAEAEQAPRKALVELLSAIEAVRLTGTARLNAMASEPAPPADELIPIEVAADWLGMSKSFLYKNHRRFAFGRRIGNKLLFSTAEITAFLKEIPLSSRKDYTSTIAVIQPQRRRRGGNE
jgi:hypothetical protein